MLFSSTIFLFLFLPIVSLVYFIAKDKYHNVILLAASLFFYAYGEPKFVFVLITSIILNYLFALGIEKMSQRTTFRTMIFVIGIVTDVSILFVCKYLNFTIMIIDDLFGDILKTLPITLPIGISFYTFQAISYLADVYRREVEAQKNPINLALYISFFPQLIAGPIVRYKTMAAALIKRQESFSEVTCGVRRFLEKMAYFPERMVSGLYLYSAWWIKSICGTSYFQSVCSLVYHRYLAWCSMEFSRMGALLFCAACNRKISAASGENNKQGFESAIQNRNFDMR